MSTQGSRTRISEALFPPARRKVLGLFFTNPDRRYHVREVIRRVGLGSGPVQNELKRLLAAGLVDVVREGRQVYYQAARNTPVYQDLRGLMLKTEGVPQVLESALQPFVDKIRVAFIFGSFARATEISASDVDLYVIGSLQLDDVAKALEPVHDVLEREINPSLVTPERFRKSLEVGDPFLQRVLDGPKLFLVGDQDVLAGLGG